MDALFILCAYSVPTLECYCRIYLLKLIYNFSLVGGMTILQKNLFVEFVMLHTVVEFCIG